MTEPATQQIADIRCEPGELSFEARLAGVEPQRIWFRSETEVVPSADAALAACLMPAMRHGGTLEVEEPISPLVLANQRDFQAIQKGWSYGWDYGEEPLEEVEVTAPSRAPDPSPPTGRVATFFSGGVDSFAAIVANPEVSDLIFVRGVDILPRLAHQDGLVEEVETRLREAAAELGKTLHVVDTNVRDLSDPLVRWEPYFACPLIAISHFFAPLFDRVIVAGDIDFEIQPPMGATMLVDELWSSEEVEVVDWGGRFSRERRVEMIAAHPVARRTLRTCWENKGGAYNCGRCRKCLLTMISLELNGALQAVETFPDELDLEVLAGTPLNQPIALALWEDLLDHVRDEGRDDIAPALEAFVAKGRSTMGLSQSYRTRQSRHGVHAKGTGAKLEATEAELETVLGSRSWKLTEPLRRLGARLRARRR
ncbi:MAG TPA: hypothetical protein VFN92_09875 [Solirubrobacterales bacterium]|nr:hypothetical protein [Solirubrobacterales bacterium]